jgi:3-deoxy-manno-octulosonate cytidylyltransferase (CMP-KDO synthetase)
MASQKNICIIPARMASSRFPNKPLTKILGMPMLGHVALRCKLEPIFSRVVVATCDNEIMDYCETIGVEAVMTSISHQRASDRIEEATVNLEKKFKERYDSVTLVQGDEPTVTPNMLKIALDGLQQKVAPVVNLKSPITDREEFLSVNCVKVVCDRKGRALYFSRSPMPYPQGDKVVTPKKAYKQVCIIPFERDFLTTYGKLEPTHLEIVESVDMNRVLEHGYDVLCLDIDEETYPVDVKEDVARVEKILKNCPLVKRYM